MEKVNGVSIIVCARNQNFQNRMIKSVEDTIGTEFEAIVFDNTNKRWNICAVYNYCAQKANCQYLCFIHEDVIMTTPGWGKNIIEFIEKTANCGVVGFAGGTIAVKNFYTWYCGAAKVRYRYYDSDIYNPDKNYNTSDLTFKYYNPENADFAKAVTLDGIFLFTRREVWQENPFDEKMIGGFHFYDADFTFGVSQKRQNYVCLTADIYHFSSGNYDITFYENACIFQKKWKHKLPYAVEGEVVTPEEEFISIISFFKYLKNNGLMSEWKGYIEHLIEINGKKETFSYLNILINHYQKL